MTILNRKQAAKVNLPKKYIITLIIIMIFVISTGFSYGFSDVSESHGSYGDISILMEANVITGYPDGSFRPQGTITRAEFVRMTNQVFAYIDGSISNVFTDVKSDDWHYKDVLISLKAGYLVGYPDGTFKPNGNVTREEACAIIDRILKLSEKELPTSPENIVIKDNVSPWANDSVKRVLAAGLMKLSEDGSFRATEKAVRIDIVSPYAAVVREKTGNDEGTDGLPGSGGGGGGGESAKIDSELKSAMSKAKSIMDGEILPGTVLTNNQKSIVRDMSSSMASFLKTGDERTLENNGKAIKKAYDKMSKVDQDAIYDEITRCIPATILYTIRDYLM